MASGFGRSSEGQSGSSGRLGGAKRFGAFKMGQEGLRVPRPAVIEDVVQNFEAVNIADKKEVLAGKMPPGTAAFGREKVITNIYGVRLPDARVFMYDVGVTALTNTNKALDMTKSSRDDYILLLRRRLCCTTFYILSQREQAVFGGKKLFYDGQKILFSFSELNLGLGPDNKRKFVVNLSQYDMKLENFVEVEFSVCMTMDNAGFALNELESLVSEAGGETNRSILQFLDIASSQTVFFDAEHHVSYRGGVSYLVDPASAGFGPTDVPDLPEGKFVAVGAKKSSIVVEGRNGRGEIRTAIAVDTSKTAFHLQQNVYEKALHLIPNLQRGKVDRKDLLLLRQQLTGLFVEKREQKESVIFQIADVTPQSAKEVKFQYDGANVSVFEYHKMRYGTTLQFPDAPMLVSIKGKAGTVKSYFPMEICYIIENQRVKHQQQTALQLKEMRTACIVPPSKRSEQNELNVRALDLLNEDNQFLAGSDIKVMKNPLSLEARILPMPDICVNNSRKLTVDLEKMWTLGKNLYMFPAEIPMWAVYLVSSDTRVGAPELNEFVKKLLGTCSAHGMKAVEPADMNRIQPERGAIQDTVELAAKHGCKFILFVQNDLAKVHEAIKDMERRYEVVTQDMKVSKMMDIIQKNRWQTLENVVNKMNVKLGGLNYGVTPAMGSGNVMKDGRLFVGIAMSHPDPETPASIVQKGPRAPTAVGFAANCKKFNYEFLGDFCFHDSRRTDLISSVELTLKRVLEMYKENRKSLPTEIVIYRGGIAEGQYNMLLNNEVPLVRKVLREAGCGNAKVTVIVVNKLHNIRIIPDKLNPKDTAMKQNLKPGTVLDTGLVHPRFSEFYLNSHKTLQGTAKIPRYTVIVDDLQLSMDDLEGMTYSLCFCHQIVNLPTSTPTPFYVATRYAERGHALMYERCCDSEGSVSSGGRFPVADPEELNKDLPYFGTQLARSRINA